MLTYKLIVGNREWLYEGPKAIKRARFAGKILLRRLGLKVGYIVPYGFVGETLIVQK